MKKGIKELIKGAVYLGISFGMTTLAGVLLEGGMTKYQSSMMMMVTFCFLCIRPMGLSEE